MKKLLFILLLTIPFVGFGQTKQELNKKLSELSNEMNKTCPMVVDECTTLISTYGGMGMIMYHVRVETKCLTDLNMSPNEWAISKSGVIKTFFCTDPSFQTFRDFGIKMIWKYSDINGKFLSRIEVTNEDCH
jgi:hypothetical protein